MRSILGSTSIAALTFSALTVIPTSAATTGALEPSAAATKALPTSTVLKDGVDQDAQRDIRKVRIWQKDSQAGVMHVAVRFRRTSPLSDITSTLVYFNVDKDKKPEYGAILNGYTKSDVHLHRTRNWLRFNYDDDLMDRGCAVLTGGQRPQISIDFTCLGVATKKIAANAVDNFQGDGAPASWHDHAPAAKKWSRPVRYVTY